MEKLTQQEESAMQAVWKAGKGFVKDFLEEHADPVPPYTTLASTIKNLEKKGFLQSRKIGNVYEYTPVIAEADYKQKFMNGFVKNYFENSYKELVTFFAKEKKISPDELKEIINMIEKGK
ncbi:Predicted transcriptional regulator [Chitinophaga terrae (ex Kim and Jung 2007)]|jgi:predicted transcriptional regulator|uniref:Predicted transcriptional regulator n=1 Tax=Chitinophaga terrae (ex Kim and Jung 2007) TaxID=408074 RepID=A0A1H3ZZ94_9BACT|nr:BlaI/MecI/CopY family transcriptional regulator [Chitinophaga terrae (ex Kim and Jung 2007)]MDQ0106118.1 putative transcriptional regulator [Chitinophaga terrae (ex Kim and Jung 2007)]GEP89957.1 transcriptional regulator [Chitinophaga terrae (ex Kim and Jung 2007)]SEA28957.1 Predicted transcriptional regulator [Chitinophaga terrae (ex Kim and Jung 2007)]